MPRGIKEVIYVSCARFSVLIANLIGQLESRNGMSLFTCLYCTHVEI